MKLQDLDANSAHLCLGVENTCRERLPIAKGQKLLLGVSGGADSIALALIFNILAPRLGIALAVCHVNHQIRPAAYEEARFVEGFCQKLNLEFVSASANVPKYAASEGIGLEEAGRAERLRELERHRVMTGSEYILTAHHAGDLAEDILLRLTRGAGWPALGGMSWQNGRILRPFLHTDPAELRSFLHICGQPWREDASNSELASRRNRFRHVFLPLFRCENPAVDAGFKKIHELARLDAAYWDAELARILGGKPLQAQPTANGKILSLARSLLMPLHPAARLRLYHLALKILRAQTGAGGQTRGETLLKLDKILQSGEGGKTVQCGGGIEAHCGRSGIIFRYENSA